MQIRPRYTWDDDTPRETALSFVDTNENLYQRFVCVRVCVLIIAQNRVEGTKKEGRTRQELNPNEIGNLNVESRSR